MKTIELNKKNNTLNKRKQIEILYEEMNRRCMIVNHTKHSRVALNGFYEFEPVIKHESKNLDDAVHNLQNAFNELVKINNINRVSFK